MTFVLTATPQPSNLPPRILLEAEESDPDVSIQSVAFFRDGVPLRFDAAVTGDIAVAYDYDAPFDVALLYRADATEIGVVDDWDETWPDLSAWTGTGWSVAAGAASASVFLSTIYRDASGTIVELSADDPDDLSVQLTDADGTVIVSATVFSAQNTVVLTGVTSYSIIGSGPFTLTLSEGQAFLTGAGYSLSQPVPYSGVPTRVQLEAGGTQAVPAGSVGEISVRIALGDPVDVTASDTATLSPTGATAGAWLVNAAVPDLAILADTEDCDNGDYYIVTTSRQSTNLDENTSTLLIEGSADVVTTTLGPRRREQWTLDVACKTEAARKSLLALLANSSPIHLRFMASQSFLGLDGGFYAVGRVTTQRDEGPAVDPLATVSLPLTPSRAPKFKPLWEWNYNTSAQTGMTYDDLSINYPSYNDLLVGPN